MTQYLRTSWSRLKLPSVPSSEISRGLVCSNTPTLRRKISRAEVVSWSICWTCKHASLHDQATRTRFSRRRTSRRSPEYSWTACIFVALFHQSPVTSNTDLDASSTDEQRLQKHIPQTAIVRFSNEQQKPGSGALSSIFVHRAIKRSKIPWR